MLPAEEIGRRIHAARILLDISQDEMTQRGHDEWGLDKGELARVERGTIKAQPYHLKLLSELLDVPLAWFTEPRETIVAQAAVDYQAVLAELERVLTRTGASRAAALAQTARATGDRDVAEILSGGAAQPTPRTGRAQGRTGRQGRQTR